MLGSSAIAGLILLLAPGSAEEEKLPAAGDGSAPDAVVEDPGPNKPEEPVAKEFSLRRAENFLDAASLHWQKRRKCMTCHTNYAYLMTVPTYDTGRAALKEVRKLAESLVAERWNTEGPRWDAEVVMTATTLAVSDAEMTGKLHPLTRKALDRMWTIQQKSGGWEWLKCGWPPMESDDHYGVTVALIGAGRAPGEYASEPGAKKGIEKARAWLTANPPPTLHHRAMVFWASKYVDEILSEQEQKETIDALLAIQRPDGGWGLATLGDWKRADGKEQDRKSSDGYGTGFVITMARLGGVPADDPRLAKGVVWLKANQRESGRWFTRSLNKDSRHFITHAGSAFAVMALHACGVKD